MRSAASLKKKFVMNTVRALNFTPSFIANLPQTEVPILMTKLTLINDKYNVIKLSKTFDNIFSYFADNAALLRKSSPDFTHEIFIEALVQFSIADNMSNEQQLFISLLLNDGYYLNLMLHSRYYIDLLVTGLFRDKSGRWLDKFAELLCNKDVVNIVQRDNIANIVYLVKLLRLRQPVVLSLEQMDICKLFQHSIKLDDYKLLASIALICDDTTKEYVKLSAESRAFIDKSVQKLFEHAIKKDSTVAQIRTQLILAYILQKGNEINISAKKLINLKPLNYLDTFAIGLIGDKSKELTFKYDINRLTNFEEYATIRKSADFAWLNAKGVTLSNFVVIDLLFLLELSINIVECRDREFSDSEEQEFLRRSLVVFRNSIWRAETQNQFVFSLLDSLVEYFSSPSEKASESLEVLIRGFCN